MKTGLIANIQNVDFFREYIDPESLEPVRKFKKISLRYLKY